MAGARFHVLCISTHANVNIILIKIGNILFDGFVFLSLSLLFPSVRVSVNNFDFSSSLLLWTLFRFCFNLCTLCFSMGFCAIKLDHNDNIGGRASL